MNLAERLTGNVGAYLAPYAGFEVGEGISAREGVVSAGPGGAQSAEEVRTLQQRVAGRVYVVQEGQGLEAHVIPVGFGGSEGYA